MQRVLLPHAGLCDRVKALIFYSGIYEPHPVHTSTLFRDGYKSRRDIDALPFSRLKRTIPKPLGVKYLESPVTLGEKIRNRRLELHLLQKDIAELIGVSEDSITYWEVKRHEPRIEYYPKIIEFLGYFPFEIDTSTLGGKIKKYRFLQGLSQKQMGKIIGVDGGTVCDWENNKTRPWRRIVEKLEMMFKSVE
jgi:transcriptional regulator with XRE-family HTH domain